MPICCSTLWLSDRGTDVAILALHDLGTDPRQVRAMLPELPNVIAPALPAHGTNPMPEDTESLSVYRMAQQVAEQLPHTVHEHPLTVIGVGLGAAIGLRLALSGVFRMDRFVAIRPSFTHYSLPDNLVVYPVVAELLGTTTYGQGIDQVMAKLVTTGIYNDTRAASRAAAVEIERLVTAPEAKHRRMRLAETPMHPAFEPHEFAALDVPAMVIADPSDPVHPLSIATEWVDYLGGAMRVTPDRGRDPQSADSWIRRELDGYLVGVR